MVYDTFAKEMVLEPTGIVKAKSRSDATPTRA